MCYRDIDKQCPEYKKTNVPLHIESFCERTANEGHCNYTKHHLICKEKSKRNSCNLCPVRQKSYIIKCEVVTYISYHTAYITAESETKSSKYPHQGNYTHRDNRLHHNKENIPLSCKSTIKQCKSRGHKANHRSC